MKTGLKLIVAFLVALSSCTKNPVDPYGKNKPSIHSFAATNPCAGTVVISGTTFDPVISRDSVFFGNVKGRILSATATEIVAEMPRIPIAGRITLYCEGRPSISNDSIFQYIPVITSFTPALAGPGTRITISGHGFNPDPSQDSVYFNNISSLVYSADSNQLVVLAPDGKTGGQITLRSNCQYAVAPGEFTPSNKGIVFIGSNGPYFYSIDIASGVIRWTFPMTSSDASPVYSNGVIYMGSEPAGNVPGGFFAFDAATGKQLWNFPTSPWGGYPTLVQDTIFAGSYDNNFYAIRAQNGQKIWQFQAGYDAIFKSTAFYYNGAIYTGNGNGNFYCLNSATGSMNWKFFIWPFGSPTVVNGIVYTSGFDSTTANNFLYALDAGTGMVKWKLGIYQLGGTPLVANGIVYIGDGQGYLNAIDALSGQSLWRSRAGPWTYFAQMVGNILYYTTQGGTLQAVDATTGNLIWSVVLALNPFDQAGAVIAGATIYAGDNNGAVHAIDAASGNTIWTLQTTGAPILSSPCVVDSSGVVYRGN